MLTFGSTARRAGRHDYDNYSVFDPTFSVDLVGAMPEQLMHDLPASGRNDHLVSLK
jgi:hypothetical protein